MVRENDRVGEVIEASTTEFVAESYRLHEAPPFGSFVRASDGAVHIYGLVCHIRTGSLDPGRRPMARGENETDEEDIYLHHPELPELLRTEFTAVVVGFREGEEVHQYLPPRPPRLHGFVYACTSEEARAFTQSLDFLPILLAASPRGPVDELIGAAFRQANLARGGDREFLVAAGKELARLLAHDPNRLSAILRRIR